MMPHRCYLVPCQRRAPGFSLIEWVVAMALLSFLSTSIGQLVRAAVAAQVRWGQTVEPYQQMERALNQLERDLVSAQPLFRVPYHGSGARVELARVEAVSQEDARPTPQWVRLVYRLEPEAGGLALIRETFSVAQGSAAPLRHERLLTLATGRFRYGALDAQGALTWQSSWEGEQQGLPRFVTLEATLLTGGGRTPLTIDRTVCHPAGTLSPPTE